ncbi:MAG: YndJ family transporter [Candidatus Dormibacteria bacterium]
MTVITVLLALAPVAVVPLALRLITLEGPTARRLVRFSVVAQPVGALAAVASLVVAPGALAGALAAIWLAVCVPASVGGLVEFLGGGFRRPASIVAAAGLGYLSVGASWLVISRLGLRPLNFPGVIVLLTAVHFHYTGLAAAALAQQVILAGRVDSRKRFVASLAAAALVVGSPITAAGFTLASGPLQVVGVALIAGSVMVLATVTLLLSRTMGGTPAVWLVRLSAASVFLPMPLAVDYTLAKLVPIPALSIDGMAAVHGTVNALVFCLCGLAGWLLFQRSEGAVRSAITEVRP